MNESLKYNMYDDVVYVGNYCGRLKNKHCRIVNIDYDDIDGSPYLVQFDFNDDDALNDGRYFSSNMACRFKSERKDCLWVGENDIEPSGFTISSDSTWGKLTGSNLTITTAIDSITAIIQNEKDKEKREDKMNTLNLYRDNAKRKIERYFTTERNKKVDSLEVVAKYYEIYDKFKRDFDNLCDEYAEYIDDCDFDIGGRDVHVSSSLKSKLCEDIAKAENEELSRLDDVYNQVSSLLADLGTTPEQITNMLMTKGIIDYDYNVCEWQINDITGNEAAKKVTKRGRKPSKKVN